MFSPEKLSWRRHQGCSTPMHVGLETCAVFQDFCKLFSYLCHILQCMSFKLIDLGEHWKERFSKYCTLLLASPCCSGLPNITQIVQNYSWCIPKCGTVNITNYVSDNLYHFTELAVFDILAVLSWLVCHNDNHERKCFTHSNLNAYVMKLSFGYTVHICAPFVYSFVFFWG